MNKLILLLIGLTMTQAVWAQSTIYSTTSGGNWNNTATWVGGIVPGPADDVVINGKVSMGTNKTCHNLTVNDTLVNDGSSCSNRHLTVTADVVNNGVITKAPHYYCSGIRLTLEGNLINKGVWDVYHTYFAGNAVQTITTNPGHYLMANGKLINEKTGGLLKAGGDLYLGNELNLAELTDLDMQNFDLHIKSAGRITNGTLLNVDGVHFADDAKLGNYIEPYTLQGTDIHFYGKAILNPSSSANHIVNGNLTVHDTLVNDGSSCSGNHRHLVINGNLINQGAIVNAPHYYCSGVKLDVTGNITNNGTWAPVDIHLTGNTDQIISGAANAWFANTGRFYHEKTGGIIRAGSDIYLQTVLPLQQSSFDLQQHDLHLHKKGQVTSGTINNLSDLYFSGGAKIGGYQTGIIINGNDIDIYGKAIIDIDRNDINTINGDVTVYDTLTNSSSSCNNSGDIHLIINGALTNLGVVYNESVYYCAGLKMELSGDLTNKGEWKPYTSALTSTQQQTLHTDAGKSLANTYRFYNNKTGGNLLVNDSFYVNTHFILNDQIPIDLNENPVYLGDKGNLTEGIIENTSDLYFEGNASLGGNVSFTPGDSLWVNGDTVTIHHHGGLLDKVTFDAVVVVQDTLINKSGGAVNVTFNKDVINHGSILNRTASYMLHNQNLKASLYNYGLWEVHNMLLTSKAMRTIKGGNIVHTWDIVFDDTLNLVGENAIPKLYRPTASPDAVAIIHPDASLEMTGGKAPNALVNKGYIHWQKDINPTYETTYSFYKAVMRNRAGLAAPQVRIKTYEANVAPGTDNTILRYWLVTNSPLTPSDTMDYLRLYYDGADLSGFDPDSLMVFYSDNSGLSWKNWDQGIYHNKGSQYFEIDNALPVGWYALAGSEIGVSRVRPTLSRVESATGGQSNMTAFVFGSGFTADATAYLENTALGTTIHPETMEVSPLGEAISMQMDLTSYPTGTYDVVVDLPGDTTMTLSNAFTLNARMEPEPFIHLSGRERVMLGRYQTYTITYGNTSNIDARAVPIYLAISEVPGLEVEFLDFDITISDSSIQKGYQSIVDTLPLYVIADTAFNDAGQVRVYPLYIPRIPANSVNSVRFRMKSNSPVKMQLAMQQPLFVNPFDPACVLGVLGEGIIDISTSAIPGVGCVWSAGKTAFKQTDKYLETQKQSWGSWLYDWTIVAVDCGVNLSGVGALAKATSLFFVNMYNYKTAFDGCRPNPVQTRDITQVASADPNAKEGPSGFGSENYIAYPDEMPYVIYFENVPTATAPAQTVTITDTLDAAVYDMSSLQFGSVNFGEEALNLVLGSSHEFDRLVDLRPEKDIVLKIEGNFNSTTGIIQWDFTSIDPMTGELTEDPLGGFLPPNVNSPEGEGSVSYFIRLKNGLPHKTEIDNKSTIVFDVNAPITTNTYINTLDLVAPESDFTQHELLNDTTVRLTWSGMDDGAEIKAYTLHVVENNNTTYDISFNGSTNSVQFVGNIDSTYRFSILAEDSVGNIEMLPAQPDLTITFEPTGMDLAPELLQLRIYPNPVRDGVINIQPSDASIRSMLVEVLGLNGQLVKAEKLDAPFALSLGDLPSGIHVLRIHIGKEHMVRKIVVP